MQDCLSLNYFIKELEKLYSENHIHISLEYLDNNKSQPHIALLAGFLMFDTELGQYLVEPNI